jgi:hypothetical protein
MLPRLAQRVSAFSNACSLTVADVQTRYDRLSVS